MEFINSFTAWGMLCQDFVGMAVMFAHGKVLPDFPSPNLCISKRSTVGNTASDTPTSLQWGQLLPAALVTR